MRSLLGVLPLRAPRSAMKDASTAACPLRLWLRLLLGILPLPSVWALANPLFASPDEPAHMVRAQGAIRGDFQNPYRTDGLPVDAVRCLAHRPEATADCLDLTWGAGAVEQRSTADTYPPLFHLVAGVPSLLVRGLAGAYVMRLWLALVCSAVLAWAAVLLWTRRPGRWSLAALCVAMTPMVVFAVATVNPSGLAAAFAALVWSAGINVTRPEAGTLIGASKITLLVALILYPLLRRDALAWEVALLLILASTLTGPRFHALRRDPLVIAGVALTAISMIWVWSSWSSAATASFVSNRAKHGGGSWSAGLGAVSGYMLQMIGMFGWADTPLPAAAFLGLLLTIAVVIVAGIAAGSRPEARATAIALVALVATPVLVGAIRYPYLQGRYLFPVFIGTVFMAGQALAGGGLSDRFSRQLFRGVIASLSVIQFLAFAQNLRRYAVGSSASWWFVGLAPWQPPMMSNMVALLLAAAAILTSVAVGRGILGAEPGARSATRSGPA